MAMLVLTFGLVAAWSSMRRRPDRWARALEDSFWRRCAGWAVVLTCAATVGITAAGGDTTLAGSIIAIGSAALVFAIAMWINAR
jgi:hypothetical protein